MFEYSSAEEAFQLLCKWRQCFYGAPTENDETYTVGDVLRGLFKMRNDDNLPATLRRSATSFTQQVVLGAWSPEEDVWEFAAVNSNTQK